MNTPRFFLAAIATLAVIGAVDVNFTLYAKAGPPPGVTITSSSAQFFGPSLERFLITDASKVLASDSIIVHVKAARGALALHEGDVVLCNIGTSGQFELFVTTSNPPFVPKYPSFTNGASCATAVNDPFIVRISSAPIAANSHESAFILGVGGFLQDGDTIIVSYGGQSVTVNFAKTTAAISVDRTQAADGNLVYVTLADQDANIDPTSISTILTNSDNPLTIAGGSVNFSGAKFIEQGQNSGSFDMQVKVTSAASVSANPPNGATLFNASFPSVASFKINDYDVYNNVPAGATAPYNVVTINAGTSFTKSVTLQNYDPIIRLGAPVDIPNGIQFVVTDPGRNNDTQAKVIFTSYVHISMDGVPGSYSKIPFRETFFNTGVFEPMLTDNTIPIHVVSGNSFMDDTSGINLNASTIASNNNLFIRYADPAAVPDTPADFQVATAVGHTPGSISTTTPTVGANGTFSLTITDNDLNLNKDAADSFTLTFDSSDSSKENAGQCFQEGLGCLTLEVSGSPINFVGSPLTATFIETGPNTGIFTLISASMGTVNTAFTTSVGQALQNGKVIEITYHDHSENPVHTSQVNITIG